MLVPPLPVPFVWKFFPLGSTGPVSPHPHNRSPESALRSVPMADPPVSPPPSTLFMGTRSSPPASPPTPEGLSPGSAALVSIAVLLGAEQEMK